MQKIACLDMYATGVYVLCDLKSLITVRGINELVISVSQ